MSQRSAHHATFTIERRFDHPPARVFAAFADPQAKKLWFKGPAEWLGPPLKLDFRVGGQEENSGKEPNGPLHVYRATIHDIVPDERIVTTYAMHMNEKLMSVSTATTEFRPDGAGTLLILTEQGVYLDGDGPADARSREEGTNALLDNLQASLAGRA
jgi:uncharacterized protein YndB with AHSA1/START domain